MTNENLPRGIRNNNPGNIRKTITKWRGETTSIKEKDFEVFEDPISGIRATMVLLLNYYLKYQLSDVLSIINRWAPPNENATDKYQEIVAKHIGVEREQRLNLFDRKVLIKLTEAIVRHENGRPLAGYPLYWYTTEQYNAAADQAYKNFTGIRP